MTPVSCCCRTATSPTAPSRGGFRRWSELKKIEVKHPGPREDGEPFLPYKRDERLARPWAIPGTPGLMHRIGGLEKQDGTGNVSYDPDNHQHMDEPARAEGGRTSPTIFRCRRSTAAKGRVAGVSWGGTYGACTTAVRRLQAGGRSRTPICATLNPFPRNLGEPDPRQLQAGAGSRTEHGPVADALASQVPGRRQGLNKVQGKPFAVRSSRRWTRSKVCSIDPCPVRQLSRHPCQFPSLNAELSEISPMMTELPVLTAADFASDQDVRWCPGCGDYSILAQMKKVLPTLGVPREKIVFVSGIGCSSRFPYYMNTYGMHSHPRPRAGRWPPD
jgi:hypothetical protein